jgi:DNA polymerase-1
VDGDAGEGLASQLEASGVGRGDLVGLTVAPGVGVAIVARPGGAAVSFELDDAGGGAVDVVEQLTDRLRPRWVMWSDETAAALVRAGLRLPACWDLAAVHRLLFGGLRADPALVWARIHDLAPGEAPADGPPDLFSHAAADAGDPDDPVRPDGYLRSEWVGGGWAAGPRALVRWADLGLQVAHLQRDRLDAMPDRPAARSTAHSESAAGLLCAELSADGLPMDRSTAEEILLGIVGPRPDQASDDVDQRDRRDAEVLRHAPAGGRVDLRSPAQVRTLLSRIGVALPDTRAWRLEAIRETHPLIDSLLEWRRAERIATTYGYAWLDSHLGADGRLRGAWTGSDGAAGRMTASGGLHNMPATMRRAVLAETGHVFVRADLGQIEPRVLAAVSGDAALARAAQEDDMYAPVASQLGVDRATAKVAVLGAMYGQTTGNGARALRRLESAYPVAMAYLDAADRSGRAGRDLRTYGGRLIRLGPPVEDRGDEPEAPGRAAARGRYGRNAVVQGAAAELFKVWAVTVRARTAALGAQIVLCLHDELLVHVPAEHGGAVARLVDEGLVEAARRWAPDDSVRFVAETSLLARWSDAKP